MNISDEKLAKRIIKHIKTELYAMQELGDIKFLRSPKDHFALWENTIHNMIFDSIYGEGYTAYFDGSATPNPGEMKIGGHFSGCGDHYTYSRGIGDGTNNEAEYHSLLYLVKRLNECEVKKVTIYGDSQLVVNQVNGTWKAKDERMKKFKERILQELSKIPKWQLIHIPRTANVIADSLT